MQTLVKYIRLLSQHGRLVTLPQVAAVASEAEPIDVVGQYLQLILAPEFIDICMRQSGEQHYFFSRRYMVESYVKRWLAINRGEILATLVAQVREASCVHNAVVEAKVLHYKPYQLDDEGCNALRQQLDSAEDCVDIAYDVNTNGEGYFYSTRGINAGYAKVLADYDPYRWSF